MAKKKPRSREEALKMMAKKQKRIESPAEDHLQQSIIVSFYDKFPETENKLIGYDGNATSGAEGAKKLGMGVRRGVSDLLLFQDGKVVAIELKTSDSRHDSSHVIEQCDFIINHAYRGGFCTSLEQFWRIHDGLENGICPRMVKKYIMDNKIKTICFGVFEK